MRNLVSFTECEIFDKDFEDASSKTGTWKSSSWRISVHSYPRPLISNLETNRLYVCIYEEQLRLPL
jgi:hypothetical protein